MRLDLDFGTVLVALLWPLHFTYLEFQVESTLYCNYHRIGEYYPVEGEMAFPEYFP